MAALPVTGPFADDAAADGEDAGAPALEAVEAACAGAAPALRVTGAAGFAVAPADVAVAERGAVLFVAAGEVFVAVAGRWAHTGTVSRHIIASSSKRHRTEAIV